MSTLRAALVALLLTPTAHAQSYLLDADASASSIWLDADTSDAPLVVDAENRTRHLLRRVPGHGLSDALALIPGVDRHEGTDSLVLNALGGDRVAYYLNGVPIRARLPWAAVSMVEAYTGHVPAALGDGLTGVVSVRSRPSPEHLTAGGALYSSTGADGNRVAAAHVGLPLIGRRLTIQAFGEIEGWADHHPRALMGPQLRSGLLEQVAQHPQVISETNEIMPTPYTLSVADFEAASLRAGSELRRQTYFGDVHWRQNDRLSLSMAVRHASSTVDQLPFGYSLFQDTPFSRTEDRSSGLQTVVEVRPRSNASVRLIGDYADARSVTYHPGFSSDVDDVLFYGDIDHPANAAAARYLVFHPWEQSLWPMYSDGSFPHPLDVLNAFAPPGAPLSGYQKSRRAQLYLAADASVDLAGHDLAFGLSFERQTRRLYRIADPYFLARYYDDGEVEVGAELAKTAYDQLSRADLYNATYYYGYDIHGRNEVSDDDPTAYAGYPSTSTDIAPFRPMRYSAYVQDRVAIGPVKLDVGLRLDAFDNNTRRLLDPYAYFPIVRAGEVNDRPEGIGADFAVYFHHTDGIVGFRDLDGNFYDADGHGTTADQIVLSGFPRTTALWMAPETFRASDVFTVLQPRLRADVAIWEGLSAFASYDRFARRPLERSYVPLSEYISAAQRAKIIDNASLKPEISALSGVGLQMELRDLRLGARVFVRTYDDLVGLQPRANAFPNFVMAYDNIYDAEARGLVLSASLMRATGAWGSAAYVLQKAEGSAIGITRPNQGLPYEGTYTPPRAALDLDRRHQIKLVAGYSVDRGPQLLGIQPLADVDLALFADIKSGRPYSTYEYIWPIYSGFRPTPAQLNGARMPWTYLLNVKVTKSFDIRGTKLAAFVWIENVLDRANVVDVYSATGLPNDDGFLASPDGRAIMGGMGGLGETYAMYYRYRTADPDHYGIPRMIRVGIDVTL